jgi:hypothetical protein
VKILLQKLSLGGADPGAGLGADLGADPGAGLGADPVGYLSFGNLARFLCAALFKNKSYSLLRFSSLKSSFALFIFLNSSSAAGSSLFLSGCHCRLKLR